MHHEYFSHAYHSISNIYFTWSFLFTCFSHTLHTIFTHVLLVVFVQNINPATLLKTQFLHFVAAEYQFMPCPMQIITKLI